MSISFGAEQRKSLTQLLVKENGNNELLSRLLLRFGV